MIKKLFFTQLLCLVMMAGYSQSYADDEKFQYAETGVRQKLSEAGSTTIIPWEYYSDGSLVIHIQGYCAINIIVITMDPDASFWVITKTNERLTPNKREKDGMYYYGFTFTSGPNTDDKPVIEYRTGSKAPRTKIFIGYNKAD